MLVLCNLEKAKVMRKIAIIILVSITIGVVFLSGCTSSNEKYPNELKLNDVRYLPFDSHSADGEV